MVRWLALLTHTKEVLGLDITADWGLALDWIACSIYAYMGFLRVLRFPPAAQKMHIMSTGYSKLPIGVNVCVDDCVSLC